MTPGERVAPPGWRSWPALLLAALLALCAAAAQAAAPVLALDAQAVPHRLDPVVRVLEDPGGQLTAQAVREPGWQARFQPVPSRAGANFGLSRSAFWLQATVQASADGPADWLLEVAYPPLDVIELYVGRAREPLVGGDKLPFAGRAVAHRNHVFPLRLVPGEPVTLLLRVQSEGAVNVPLRLWTPQAMWRNDQVAYGVLSLYFGLLGGLLLYNLLLYATLREPAWGWYVAFVGSMAVAQATLDGVGAQFLWPQAAEWNSLATPVSLAASALLGMQFARSFLDSRSRLPRLDRLMRALAVGWAVAAVVAVGWSYWASSRLTLLLAPVSVGAMLLVGWQAVRAEVAGARQFFLAWAMLMAGTVVMLLHNTAVLPSNPLTAHALQIGSALEMVLLSFALANRMEVARRFKVQAQARIAAERAMVGALTAAQQQLRDALAEREVILANSLVGIVFLTPEGRLKWANNAFADIIGEDRATKLQSMEQLYLSREQYLQVGAEADQAVAQGRVYERELQIRRLDGRATWVQLSGKAVEGGRSGGTVWVVRDVTQRKRLQEQLRATMDEREAILNNAVVGIVLSVHRVHEWVNDKFARMLGYPREQLIGQSSSYIHPDLGAWERFGREARASLIATNGYTCERQLRRRDGGLFWVEMGGSCIRANDPDSGVIWTFLDITGRKQSEAEMLGALEQQKALNELRSRFVAMTSHEFRTPLAAILSAEEVLRHYGDRLPEAERLETLDSIAQGVQRMTRMLDRVLLLGKADAQLLEFEPATVNVPALCRRLVEEVWSQHPDTACDIAVRAGPGVGDCVCDEKLLRHIFGNLLSNAIKYSPDGGKVRFDVRREDAELVFEVADRGIGIPAGELGDLFESFHRASNVGAIQGTGLGLAIVKNAVQVHGGRIAVESRLGEGTTFTVRLPLRVAAPAPA